MDISWRSVRFHCATLAIIFFASSALAQHGLFSANGKRAGIHPPTIVNPRTSSASPTVSSLNVSGTWTVTSCCYNFSVVLNQDQAGNITGSVTGLPGNASGDPPCFAAEPVSGAVTGSNAFSFSAAMEGGDNECEQVWSVDATMTSDTVASAVLKVFESSDESEDPIPDVSGTMTRNTIPIKLIDPVASGLLDGTTVTENVDAIAGAANPIYVSGTAADGVTQVIVEVTQVQPGDSVQLTLVNESGQQDSTANDGGLIPLGGDPASAASTLTFQAQNTDPPMAIALWVAPSNFSRGSQDATALQRSLTIQAQDTNTTNNGSSSASGSQPVALVRPPVVLIHGLWSSGQGTWGGFNPVSGQNASLWAQMKPQPADYSQPVQVTASNPSYSSLSSVTAASLGFSFNAPNILLQLQNYINNYGVNNNVAVVQADVVGHSMGGDIARTMAGLSNFTGQNDYGLGSIHKLITIGTPHTGTQLAFDLLPGPTGDPNACVRNAINRFAGNPSFLTATVNGITVNGAVGDLRATSLPLGPFPIAYIAATTTAANLSNLDASAFSASGFIHNYCGKLAGSPLAMLLTSTTWNQEFSGAANDGIVPLTSQVNGTTSTLIFSGIIHSPGIESLNFNPPTEVDSASGIPDEVINLLNEPINGADFFPSN
ncbi:MAG TPA: hypothetical protein VFA71_06225 [Terriglobales bacterium]|nr:hypothetical protein [Terriglobales bacterium]